MAQNKKELLETMFILYWQYDVVPTFGGTDDNPTASDPNSVEGLVLKVYDHLKQGALSAYQWRSTIKYVDLTLTAPAPEDERYNYTASAPVDFLVMQGFWKDPERQRPCHNEVDMVGTEIRSDLEEVTMAYIADTIETSLDRWVIDWIMIYIAAEAADIAGISDERKDFLISKRRADFFELSNKDYEMAHKDEVSNSKFQFSSIY